MSEVYTRRLSRVQREYDATRNAAGYVIGNWQGQSITDDTQRTSLKEHLAQHHPSIAVPEEARAVWLIIAWCSDQVRPSAPP